jgi:endonuclease/exonuclease/phosphatase family metal-dependent hydrolase
LRPIPPAITFALLLLLQGLEARTVRIATFNIENGPGAPGTSDYEATKAVLGRINADIVGLQELLLSNEPALLQMAAELGYEHVEIGRDGTTMSGTQRLGYFSRFPITEVGFVRSPAGANEMSRLPMRVVVEVPGAAKPLVLWNMHHKADDPTPSNTPGNQFRRAVEAYRIAQDINAYRAANPEEDEFVMLGDLNDDVFQAASQALQFDAIPPLTASSYQLGADVPWPVPYRAFPDDRYAAAGGGLHRMDVRQQDTNSRGTRGSRVLDYLLISTPLRDSPLGAPRGEIYNSQWDTVFAGLPKAGQPLASGTSSAASDHLAVFADLEMDDAVPATVVVSPEDEVEFSGPSGGPFAPTLTSYTISNPTPQPVELTVSADVPWLVPGFSDGVAGGLGQIGLDVSVDAAAAPTRPGEYLGRLRIIETSTGASVVRMVRLRVDSTGFDFLTQDFTGAAPFNLANKSVTFTPDGSPGFYRATIRGAASLPVDPAGGVAMTLGDDAFAAVEALPGRVFRFFGRTESRLFVGSNGYVTFVSGDADFSPSLEDHFRLPRISAAFEDFDPRTIGAISYRWLSDRMAITWLGVPRYGATTPNTFQVELFNDGRIRFTWLAMGNVAPIVGLSPGTGLSPAFEGSVFGGYPSTEGLPLAYEDFVGSYGLDPLGNGGLSADADGDGSSNWLEFAFGSSPVVSQGALLGVSAGEGLITFEFLRRLSGVSYTLESSMGLQNGFAPATGISPVRAVRQSDVPDGWERASFTVPASGAGFYRIGASPN